LDGFDERGAESCHVALRTAGPAAALQLRVESPWPEPGREVVIVAAQIVDAVGVPVMDAHPPVSCRVDGAGRLLGLEAADLRDVSDATATVRAAYHGRVVAYVQATGASGAVQVQFSAPGLPPATQLVSAPTRAPAAP
jgi:hypothetical protein